VGSIGAGLGRFNQRTGRFKTYRHHASDPSSLSDDAVSRVFIDHSGTMWVTTWNGLDRFDPVTERFVVYKRDKESQTEQYYNITQDQAGTLWIGGINGLTRFEPDSGRFTLYRHQPGDPGSISNNIVNSVSTGHLGMVWAATQNGLNKLDAKTGTFTKYYATDGLPISNLSCILEDGSGKLWISTSRGLSKFDPVAKTFKNYSTADGLPGDDLTGWDACFKNASGEMFFGGFSGGIAFYPDKVEDTSYIPPIVLTDFQLSGNPVEIGSQSLLKKSITYTNALTLSHEQNVFSLTFSALSYLNPTANRYRYMLDGLDHHWTEMGSDRRLATYTTLPPATYTFLVQGATSRGAWSEPGVKLGITILPPWWATLWFRSLCVAAFLVLLWGLYQFRLRQIAHEFDVRLEERVGERTRIARELHDSLLQGFQGLMFRLQAVRNMLPGPSKATEALDIALDRADKAIAEGRDTVSDLRLSAVSQSDIGQALTALGQELAAQSDNHAVPCVRVLTEGKQRGLAPLLRDEIYRIAREALRNAFRHANAQKIEAAITYADSEFFLHIRDDGIGIDPAVGNQGTRDGHWGLPGMRERAKSFGGKLEIWSEKGAGTEIALTVPASVAYGKSDSRRRFWSLRRKT